MYSNKMKKRWPKSFKLLLRISEQYGTNIGKQNGKQFESSHSEIKWNTKDISKGPTIHYSYSVYQSTKETKRLIK